MSRTPSLKKRRRTLKKKAEELSTLCDIDVAYICFEPNTSVHHWPEDPNKVKDSILKYWYTNSSSSSAAASPASSGINGGILQDDELDSLTQRIDVFSQEELGKLLRLADHKLNSFRDEIASLESSGFSRETRPPVRPELKTANLIDLVGLSNQTAQPEFLHCYKL
ncbi:Agamous-like MADS-box protein AGL103 [Linum perenne]